MNELKFIKEEILTMMRFQYDVAETIEGKDSVSARARQQKQDIAKGLRMAVDIIDSYISACLVSSHKVVEAQ